MIINKRLIYLLRSSILVKIKMFLGGWIALNLFYLALIFTGLSKNISGNLRKLFTDFFLFSSPVEKRLDGNNSKCMGFYNTFEINCVFLSMYFLGSTIIMKNNIQYYIYLQYSLSLALTVLNVYTNYIYKKEGANINIFTYFSIFTSFISYIIDIYSENQLTPRLVTNIFRSVATKIASVEIVLSIFLDLSPVFLFFSYVFCLIKFSYLFIEKISLGYSSSVIIALYILYYIILALNGIIFIFLVGVARFYSDVAILSYIKHNFSYKTADLLVFTYITIFYSYIGRVKKLVYLKLLLIDRLLLKYGIDLPILSLSSFILKHFNVTVCRNINRFTFLEYISQKHQEDLNIEEFNDDYNYSTEINILKNMTLSQLTYFKILGKTITIISLANDVLGLVNSSSTVLVYITLIALTFHTVYFSAVNIYHFLYLKNQKCLIEIDPEIFKQLFIVEASINSK